MCLDLEISNSVFDVWRIMDFRRRPGSDQPETQMFENVSDHRHAFDALLVTGWAKVPPFTGEYQNIGNNILILKVFLKIKWL
jgi:hypothetical protein